MGTILNCKVCRSATRSHHHQGAYQLLHGLGQPRHLLDVDLGGEVVGVVLLGVHAHHERVRSLQGLLHELAHPQPLTHAVDIAEPVLLGVIGELDVYDCVGEGPGVAFALGPHLGLIGFASFVVHLQPIK